MENASKALIIAGAILLAILIISLGILIYNQASGVATENSMDEVSIQTFNNKFLQYAGKQKGAAVRALLSQISASNASEGANGHQVKTNPEDVNTASIKTGETYTVTVTIDDTSGYVSNIKIEGEGVTPDTDTDTDTDTP